VKAILGRKIFNNRDSTRVAGNDQVVCDLVVSKMKPRGVAFRILAPKNLSVD
jgi:hypothetical protein